MMHYSIYCCVNERVTLQCLIYVGGEYKRVLLSKYEDSVSML